MSEASRVPTIARDLIAGLRAHGRDRLYSSDTYRRLIDPPFTRRRTGDPVLYARDPWPGSVEVANALFQGNYSFAGETVRSAKAAPWRALNVSERWLEAVNGFAWLRHFSAADGETARRHVRALIAAWIDVNGGRPAAWRAHVTARRLISWICHGALVFDGADESFRDAVLASVRVQVKHLDRCTASIPDGPARIAAAAALVLAACAFDPERRTSRKRLARAMNTLEAEIEAQVLPDGGHVSRNPGFIAPLLGDLITVRDTLADTDGAVPECLSSAIGRLSAALRFFRHGDGGLAVFNGAEEGDPADTDAILKAAGGRSRAFAVAPHSGFQRLAARRTLVICDNGAPPAPPYDRAAYAGTLSIEISSARQRLVVNCGPGDVLGPDWRRATRASAAHSTLVAGDTSSCRFGRDLDGLGIIGGIVDGPTDVSGRRTETEDGHWLDMSHDGYEGRFGLIHHRRLFVDREGDRVEGEDSLGRATDETGARRGTVPETVIYAVRFHLHPGVRASKAGDNSVLLRLANGEGWRFRSDGGDPKLEESIYLGDPSGPRRTEQIVLEGRMDSFAINPIRIVARWAFERV